VSAPTAAAVDGAQLIALPAAASPLRPLAGAPGAARDAGDDRGAPDAFASVLLWLAALGAPATSDAPLPPSGQNLPLTTVQPPPPGAGASLPPSAGSQSRAPPLEALLSAAVAPEPTTPIEPSAASVALAAAPNSVLDPLAPARDASAAPSAVEPSRAVLAAALEAMEPLSQEGAPAPAPARGSPRRASGVARSDTTEPQAAAPAGSSPARGNAVPGALEALRALDAAAQRANATGGAEKFMPPRLDTRELKSLTIADAASSSVALAAPWRHASPPVVAAPVVVTGPPVEASAEPLGDTLAEHVESMLDQKLGEVRVKLNPPELGALDIKVSLVDERAHVEFTVAHHAAREAIEAALPRLRDLLVATGLELGSASVGGGHSQHPGGRPAPSWPLPGACAEPVPPAAGAASGVASPLAGAPGAIDLYA
jgi:flagellar hook-length control protein FliK